MGLTLTEKIFARAAGRASVRAGEALVVRPDHALAYDFPGYSDRLLESLQKQASQTATAGDLRVGQRVMFIDHLTTRRSARIDAVHAQTREGAQRFGFELQEGRGIGHQVASEIGLARPGALLVHFDPHVAVAGAVGALGIGVGYRYEPIWATGLWSTQVPPSVAMQLQGRLNPWADARDLLHAWIRDLAGPRLAGTVLEIHGAESAGLTLCALQGLCGMSIFTGALSSVVVPGSAPLPHREGEDSNGPDRADPDALYRERIAVDLTQVVPLVALPGSCRPDHIAPVATQQGVRITRAFVGSCASGRLQDIRAVAAVMQGRRVAAGVRFLLTPTTHQIRQEAQAEGLLAALEAAGVEVQAPSCDTCYGFAHPLAPDDVCVSSGTLNVPGRMGSAQASIFLASPATVAAAAVAGHLLDPRDLLPGSAA